MVSIPVYVKEKMVKWKERTKKRYKPHRSIQWVKLC
jgi:hypothetical protein